MALTFAIQMQQHQTEAKAVALSSPQYQQHYQRHHHRYHQQQQQQQQQTQQQQPNATKNLLPPPPRLRKRHSIYDDKYYANENASGVEWQNPCGGIYEPKNDNDHGRRAPVRHHLRNLKRVAGTEYTYLNGSQQDIDISNIDMWFLHNYTYKFLPTLKRNSSVALKRWYRNMQTFVASFAYLRRTEEKWDHSKSLQESKTTKELHQLMISARYILCEIETAINNTYPYDHDKKLTTISREAMNKRLKFRTKKHEANGLLQEVDTIDLKFVKYYYYDFLSTMWKILRRNTRRRGQNALINHSGQSHNSSNKSKNQNNSEGYVSAGLGGGSSSWSDSGTSWNSASVSSYEVKVEQPNSYTHSHRTTMGQSGSQPAAKRRMHGRARQRKNKKSHKNFSVHQLNEVTSFSDIAQPHLKGH